RRPPSSRTDHLTLLPFALRRPRSGRLEGRTAENQGFTLIEIMVVVLIIGIAASFAVLRFGDFGQTRRMQNSAMELYLLLHTAQQQAVLQPAIIGWAIKGNGFGFYQFVVADHNASWQPLTHDRLFRFHDLGNKIVLQLRVLNRPQIPGMGSEDEQDLETIVPKLIFLPSGYVTPFVIRIGLRDHPPSYEITGNAAGEIKMQELKVHGK
ncbi:MAG: type II secretion system minor pseudopilin GspH, partial [Gammaproteobacteria bacterium]